MLKIDVQKLSELEGEIAMKYLVVSDSFKGTLTSTQIGEIVQSELNRKDIECDYIPVSDGGEGFIECISYIDKIEPTTMETIGALGEKESGKYLYNPTTKELFIELAEAVGINKLTTKQLNVLKASTYGLGVMLKTALDKHHPKTVYIGLGGSASIDLGAGLLEGLGVIFKDTNNQVIHFPGNEALGLINHIDDSALTQYRNIEFKCIIDVNILLFTQAGAVVKYSAQKGAKKDDVPHIKSNAEHFISKISKHLNKQINDFPGAGSAGGTSFGLVTFLNAKLENGIDFILSRIKLDQLKNHYDRLITGEGRLDSQTFQGKLVSGILKVDPNALILAGSKEEGLVYDNSITIVPDICSLEESLSNPEYAFRALVRSINWNNL